MRQTRATARRRGRCGHSRRSRSKLTAFKEAGAEHINIQLCDHDTEIRKAVTVARAVMQAGKELKLKPAIEWHRDTCTETPEKGLALAAQYEKRYKEKLRTISTTRTRRLSNSYGLPTSGSASPNTVPTAQNEPS